MDLMPSGTVAYIQIKAECLYVRRSDKYWDRSTWLKKKKKDEVGKQRFYLLCFSYGKYLVFNFIARKAHVTLKRSILSGPVFLCKNQRFKIDKSHGLLKIWWIAINWIPITKTHTFIEQIFIECLLQAKYTSRHIQNTQFWGYVSAQNKWKSLNWRSDIALGHLLSA